MEIPPISLEDVKDGPGDYIGCEICRYIKECFNIRLNELEKNFNIKENCTMKTENKNMDEKKLISNEIDPFMVDDDQTKVKKAEAWQEIFLRCPEFSDLIIDFYKTYGEECLNDLIITHDTDKKKFKLSSLTPQPSDKLVFPNYRKFKLVEDDEKEEE